MLPPYRSLINEVMIPHPVAGFRSRGCDPAQGAADRTTAAAERGTEAAHDRRAQGGRAGTRTRRRSVDPGA